MDQKQVPPTAPGYAQNIGFQPPPAYEQHQQFQQQYTQQYQGIPAPGQQQVITGMGIFSSAWLFIDVIFFLVVITSAGFGPDPAQITCPSCGQITVTKIDYESSTKTHLMAGLLCLLVWPCFCLPYLMDSCKNANHYCTNCSAYLGTYRGS